MGSGIFYIVRFYGSGNFGLKYGRNYGSITIGHTGAARVGDIVQLFAAASMARGGNE
jgi:hypothetical protein